MKAITIWQPWAQLIVFGEKKIETRSWQTKVRGTIAIHAAKKDCFSLMKSLPLKEQEYFEEAQVYNYYDGEMCVPLGAIIGTVDLVDCLSIEELMLTTYAIKKEIIFGDWAEGRFGWVLENPIQFDTPIPVNGHQGFWNWKESE